MMAQKLDILSDDMSITRGLLGRPDIPPRRRTSFTSTTRSAHTQDVSNDLDESTSIKDDGRRRRVIQSSNTWTTSSGEILSDKDDIEDRILFITEYNRLATKHGVRSLIPEDSDSSNSVTGNGRTKSGNWFSRKILRRTSSSHTVTQKNDRLIKHKRSISDLSLRLKSKSDTLKDKDLQELVRLCGLTLLYLPTEYAAGSLAVPTCFRATAQYLVQHGELCGGIFVVLANSLQAPTTRGVFRISGSHNVVAALYNHYCKMDDHGSVVSGTVRCPTLPDHIRCDVHDVATAFKKFISGLPGGILGSLSLFDAFVSIQSQLNSSPELTRTKQSKVRARLIALAIATLRSQYRRELICAVFGLLSLVGRSAEIAPRENERGQPLPTSDLMGYGPLGIVFGPLLVGDLLVNYTMHVPNPRGGLVLLPISPPKSRKERNKKNKTSDDCSHFNAEVDKIKIANSITEMLITHWRDVVRHMKSMKALKIVRSYRSLEVTAPKQPFLRPSMSESFALRKPPDWDNENSPIRQIERCESPTPASRGGGFLEARLTGRISPKSNDTLNVRKQRSRPRPMTSQMLSGARSMSILSPTKEENPAECSPDSGPSVQELTTAPPNLHQETHPFSSSPGATFPKTSEVPKVTSPNTLMDKNSQPDALCKQLFPLSDNSAPGLSNRGIYDGSGTPSKSISGDSFLPVKEHKVEDCPFPIDLRELVPITKLNQQRLSVREHELIDCPPPAKSKDCAPTTKPKYLLKQKRQLGIYGAEPSASHQSHPNITLSTGPSSGQKAPTVGALRRFSASEPGLQPEIRPDMPCVRSIRHSKSSFIETDRRSTAENWHTLKDPLAIVSIADDMASLATLAHVLEEESEEPRPKLDSSGRVSGETFDKLAGHNIESLLPKLTRDLEETERRRALSKEEYEFLKLAREVTNEYDRGILLRAKYDILIGSMGELALQEVSLNAKDSRPEQKALETPRVIKGPHKNHLSEHTPNPKKKSVGQYFGISESLKVVTDQGPVVLSGKRVSVDIQVEPSQMAMSQNPRLSVRALAAKFNEESRSISTPSPTKSLSKATLIDIRGSPDAPEKIVAPYTTNPPSPAKSSVSNVSIHSVRIAPLTDRTAATGSTPRRLLRSDLRDSTPLRPVPTRQSILLAPGSPACCSLAGSPARLSLYDGSSVPVSARPSSEEPNSCVTVPYVQFESKELSVAIEKAMSMSKGTEIQSLPMAINPLTSPTPSRSNSLLHAQIRNLQQLLNKKMEEVRHLKQQLGTRGNLGIGTLSEELREAKKEVQTWKHRAEVAENQLQVMATLSRRNSSSHITLNSSMAVGNSGSTPSRINHNEDGAVMANKIKRALHGLDGASSPPNLSDCSTGTVVRDVRREESFVESE